MAMEMAGTCEYRGRLRSEGVRPNELLISARTTDDSETPTLLGPDPTIRIWEDQLVLIASSPHLYPLRSISFAAGRSIRRVARPGDMFHVHWNGAVLGLSILREESLVLALGRVSVVPLGEGVSASWPDHQPAGPCALAKHDLEVRVGQQRVSLDAGQCCDLGGYSIYVERACWCGEDEQSESAAIVRDGDQETRYAAARGAILLLALETTKSQ